MDWNTTDFWTAVAGVGQAAAAIMAISAFIYSLSSFKKSLDKAHYDELDRLYFDVLALAINQPDIQDPGGNKSDEDRARYGVFAFIMWNFLETIYDRCQSKSLRETWLPIFDTEGVRHYAWFAAPENQGRFKKAFKDYANTRLRHLLPADCPEPS